VSGGEYCTAMKVFRSDSAGYYLLSACAELTIDVGSCPF